MIEQALVADMNHRNQCLGVVAWHWFKLFEHLFDYQRIKILNGLQALFFGKYAIACALSFNTDNHWAKQE